MGEEAREAIGRLYDEHGAALFRFCHRLSLNRDEAADLVQETFLDAMRAASPVGEMDSPRAWLYRVAVRRWARRRRGIGRIVSLLRAESLPAPPSSEFIDLERALARMPLRHRAAFVLVRAEGLTYAEAAAALGAPEGTVKSWVHDATAALRRDLTADAAVYDNA